MADVINSKKRTAGIPTAAAPTTSSQPTGKKEHAALTGWPMIVFFLGMLVFTIHACTHMVAAGDTWVAFACGRHFINHGVDTVEPFSANSHKAGPTKQEIETWPKFARWVADKVGLETVKRWHPTGWVNQNWLTHVLFYWLAHLSPFADAQTFSYNTLVYWKVAIYILNILCVYYIARLLGTNPALSAAFASFALFVGRSFLDIRPQGFTNLLVPTFILILVLATYRNILYIWLVVPLTVLWCNLHGGYIYVFIILVPFIFLNLLTSASNKWFVSIGIKGGYHAVTVGIVTFIAAVIFNPFHLTNFTHTYVISFSKNAELWRTVNEWHPAFEWTNPVGTGVPYAVMLGIFILALLVWLIVLAARPSPAKKLKPKAESDLGPYRWPKIDLALITIAAMTVYMAYRSRRFIPIAGSAACPVTAMLIDQAVRMISAKFNFNKTNRLFVSGMPRWLEMTFASAAIIAVVSFGSFWGWKIKRIYLDPWSNDPKYSSIFMRLTASFVKPFEPCQFIRENKLKGKMFNYWTEGGFIAYGQDPDPNTGKTPLQLFVDGRAQAAYNENTYKLWANIMAGGPIINKVAMANRQPTPSEWEQIAAWINTELKQRNDWVILMPVSEFDSDFVRAIERKPNWRPVFIDGKQKLFVDIETEQGQKLFDGLFNNQTKFPDDYYKFLALAYNLTHINNQQAVEQGFAFAVKAMQLNPDMTPMMLILFAAQRDTRLQPLAVEVLAKYFDDFEKNKASYAKKDGYAQRLAAARTATEFLARVTQDQQRTQFYAAKLKGYADEHSELLKWVRW